MIDREDDDFVLEQWLLIGGGDPGVHLTLPRQWAAFEAFPWNEYEELLGVLHSSDMAVLQVGGADMPFSLYPKPGCEMVDFLAQIPDLLVMSQPAPTNSMVSGTMVAILLQAREQFPIVTARVLATLEHLQSDLERLTAVADQRVAAKRAHRQNRKRTSNRSD